MLRGTYCEMRFCGLKSRRIAVVTSKIPYRENFLNPLAECA
jgi:hypothetical protein